MPNKTYIEFSIRLPADLYEKVRDYAEAHYTTRASVVRHAVALRFGATAADSARVKGKTA